MRKLPYQFGNNMGRLRGKPKGGNQILLDFRGSLVTNAEKPLTTFTSEGGGKRRVIELQTPDVLFDLNTIESIHNTIEDNYGLFGRTWIEIIKEHNKDMIDVYKTMRTLLIHKYPNKVPRHLHSLAAIITANHFFTALCLNTNEEIDVCELLPNFIHPIIMQLPEQKELADYVRAKSLIHEWVISHPKNFSETENVYELYGVYKKDYLAVFPSILHKFLQEQDMSPEVIIKQLADDGFIQKDQQRLTKVVKINNKSIRMYCLKLEKD